MKEVWDKRGIPEAWVVTVTGSFRLESRLSWGRPAAVLPPHPPTTSHFVKCTCMHLNRVREREGRREREREREKERGRERERDAP